MGMDVQVETRRLGMPRHQELHGANREGPRFACEHRVQAQPRTRSIQRDKERRDGMKEGRGESRAMIRRVSCVAPPGDALQQVARRSDHESDGHCDRPVLEEKVRFQGQLRIPPQATRSRAMLPEGVFRHIGRPTAGRFCR